MLSKLRWLCVMGSGAVLFLFALFFLGQAAEVAGIAEGYFPGSRPYVLWSLTGILVAFFALPAALFLQLPPPLLPPKSDDPRDIERHLRHLRRRLQANPLLAGRSLESREELEAALEVLARAADELTRETARSVFILTAVSPNGRFDLITVLAY